VNVLGGTCCVCQCKLQLDLNTKVNLVNLFIIHNS